MTPPVTGIEVIDHPNRRSWVLRRPAGAIEIWRATGWAGGGIEVHRHVATDEKNDRAHCWLLGGPCAHDGSSLAFSRQVAPLLGDDGWPLSPAASTALLAVAVGWADHQFGVAP